MNIHIYTDGASRGNPGPGGYGTILMFDKFYKELSGGFKLTTNNRMELMAVIAGLEILKRKDIPITIFSDSKYVVDSVNKKWLQGWLKTNFKGKKNRDLWERYHAISQGLSIQFVWVKGHADNPYNNRCDELATQAADGKNLLEDTGYQSNA